MHQHGSPSALPRAPRHGGHGTATRVDTGLRRGEAGRATSGMSGRWTRGSDEGRYWASSRGGRACYVGDVGSVDTGQNRWRGQETRWRPGVAGAATTKATDVPPLCWGHNGGPGKGHCAAEQRCAVWLAAGGLHRRPSFTSLTISLRPQFPGKTTCLLGFVEAHTAISSNKPSMAHQPKPPSYHASFGLVGVR
jgi:hypothetical protein